MRIPLTAYGRRESVWIVVLTAGAASVGWWLLPVGRPWVQVGCAMLAAGGLAFFRDPYREVPPDPDVLLAPADGRVTDVIACQEDEFIKGPAVRIGIFLSVFDVHINRSPCAGRVAYLRRHPGKCLNALRAAAASAQNEAQSMGLECPSHPAGRVLVKQITGAIARRIVCTCGVGDELAAGERYGMIKFGSRTELFIPKDESARIRVKKGDVVRAGLTMMVLYGADGAAVLADCRVEPGGGGAHGGGSGEGGGVEG